MMKSKTFIRKVKEAATNYKTLYVMGCFGAPLNSANKSRYCSNHSYNTQPNRTAMIRAASDDTFGFDCVNLIKGILWGWSGNVSKVYGGAVYGSNGVPDTNADGMIQLCQGVSSTGWLSMVPGEAVWMKGHIGVYIGNGLAVECTPSWKNCVQITAVGNIGSKSGYNTRIWTKHGKLPYVDYSDQSTVEVPSGPKKTVDELAREVLDGKWGNGADRKKRLTDAGYNYTAVQNRVNELVNGTANKPPTSAGSQTTTADEKTIWNFLMQKFGNPYGVAGIMGNLYAESGLIANNLQNSYNSKFSMSDVEYTNAVDAGTYSNFAKDYGGYGLAQWTYHTRKANLLAFARSKNVSVGNLNMQLEFLYQELTSSYAGLVNIIKTAKDVTTVSTAVLKQFERPADMSASVQYTRASFGMRYYNKYAGTTVPTEPESEPTTPSAPDSGTRITKKASRPAMGFDKTIAGKYKVTAQSGLYIRNDAGTGNVALGILPSGTVVNNYGYYTSNNGTRWLYVAVSVGNIDYIGFCSSEYLVKQ